MLNSFNTKDILKINQNEYTVVNLNKLDKEKLKLLPYSHKILLENLLRCEDGHTVTKEDIDGLLNWDPKSSPNQEIAFKPARVILQDFTGVPAIVDLAAMRDATSKFGKNPQLINPLSPVELVVDHSVMVDNFGNKDSATKNTVMEFKRNNERYEFLHWGQQAFNNFKVVPPNTGIVHQVNLEHLARVVFKNEKESFAYPDTLVGTDSHTTMINGLGILAWGVGGIEAEAAMLGQSISMLVPQVIGFKITGKLPEGSTATDLVLVVVEMLRKKGVVGKFVEFFGDGLKELPVADRATIANMAPEYGATCGIFPIDQESLEYLRLTGRNKEHIEFVEKYSKQCGFFYDESNVAEYTDILEIDISTVKPCIAGPSRPQDRIELDYAKKAYQETIEKINLEQNKVKTNTEGLQDGAVVIAAITSCTNTSNPTVMLAAGLLARNAVARGLTTKPWVKTSVAPGSKVVSNYLNKAGLQDDLDKLGFNIVGFGCTTCIGNSGPLIESVSKEIKDKDLTVAAALSGNRNFEGRVHPEVKLAYLASPPLVVAYALAGTMNIDFYNEPLGHDKDNNPVFLKDIWPNSSEITSTVASSLDSSMFIKSYTSVFSGDDEWNNIQSKSSDLYPWNNDSSYVKNPPYFENMSKTPAESISSINGARVLALLGDSVTTDHISPAGAILESSPAGEYLKERGIDKSNFNSYGSRRGNHEVMMRGTFANIRLQNLLAPGTTGGVTTYHPTGEQLSIFAAAQEYKSTNTPTIILAGKEYGTGSSRDWAAKGPCLLGVKAVICESFERIHRSNLIGMGILPLNFLENESSKSLGLDGTETYDFDLSELAVGKNLKVIATKKDANKIEFNTLVRIDTPRELDYFKHGGILHFVLRQIINN